MCEVFQLANEEGSYRVNRGGSWWNNPGNCRSSNRNNNLGFRVTRSSANAMDFATD